MRDSARACHSAIPKESQEGETDAARQQVKGLVDEVRKVAERMAAASEADVLWLAEREGSRGGNELRIAPVDVALTLRDKLFGENTVVLTSATLKLGGGFDAVARSVGLWGSEQVGATGGAATAGEPGDGASAEGASEDVAWDAIDVGSPFDYAKQAMLYVARHLPPPGRDGMAEATLDEIVDLVQAAGGRTLGLFSSRRAAEAAAEVVRERLPDLDVLCQGDAQLPELARRFTEDPQRLSLRHAEPLAGRRHAGDDVPAGDHRPDPVPAARRPADECPSASRRASWRQRLHGGRCAATPRSCWRRAPDG